MRLTLTALALFAAAPAFADTVTVGFGSLPSAQGFTYIAAGPNLRGEAAYYSATGFSLDQDTRGDAVTYSGGAYYSRPVALGPGGNFRVDARAVVRQYEGTVLGGGTTYPFGFFFGVAGTYVGIAGERFATYSHGAGVRYYDIPTGFSINTTHDYMVKSVGGLVTFAADGVTLFTDTLTGSTTGSDRFEFGDGTGYANAAGRYFALSYTSAAVPEPASWALMLGGFGLVGALARRGSARAVAA